ncbi:MAG: hypothetical protein ACPGN3_10725 [Opitutales bacterium]
MSASKDENMQYGSYFLILFILFSSVILNGNGDKKGTLAKDGTSFSIHAVDIEDRADGAAPFTKERKRGVLQINAAKKVNRDKWARASVVPGLKPGDYDVTLIVVLEEDGESPYRLYVNDHLIGEKINRVVGKEENFDRTKHLFKNVNIPEGAEISIESKAVTNGKIPEGDGTAWARGRWASLSIEEAK